jgi:hypothetical protein
MIASGTSHLYSPYATFGPNPGIDTFILSENGTPTENLKEYTTYVGSYGLALSGTSYVYYTTATDYSNDSPGLIQVFPLDIDGIPLDDPSQIISSNGINPGWIVNAGTTSLYVINFGFVIPEPSPKPTTIANKFPGQAGETANLLNNLSNQGLLPSFTNTIYQTILPLSYTQQYQDLLETSPQYKVIQFASEKLDLLLHKELESALYENNKRSEVFVLGGYDNFSQDKNPGYVGYNVDNFYQLLGFAPQAGKMKYLIAAGASESYMSLNPTSSRASYTTAWGALGLSGKPSRWSFGLDGLFGYSFIDSKRNVSFLNYQATSNHGLWNASVDGKIGYTFTLNDFDMLFYDNIGYLYGHENSYKEKGVIGSTFTVQNENISVIRNQVGFKFVAPTSESIKFFVDSAWVYEYYTNSNVYQAAFTGTDVFQNYTQTIPTKNYGRVNAGFHGTHRRFDWRVAYTGLYGKGLRDSAASLKLAYLY